MKSSLNHTSATFNLQYDDACKLSLVFFLLFNFIILQLSEISKQKANRLYLAVLAADHMKGLFLVSQPLNHMYGVHTACGKSM